MSRIGKSIEIYRKYEWLTGPGQKGEQQVTANGNRLFWEGDENVLKLDSDDVCLIL